MLSRSRSTEFVVRHFGQPDVGVETDLVAGVAGQHRPATRLRHVADQQAVPAILIVGVGRQAFDQRHHVGMGPVAVARLAHHLPVGAIEGQIYAARQASLGVGAKGLGLHGCRHLGGAKHLLGRLLQKCGVAQGRKRRLFLDRLPHAGAAASSATEKQ